MSDFERGRSRQKMGSCFGGRVVCTCQILVCLGEKSVRSGGDGNEEGPVGRISANLVPAVAARSIEAAEAVANSCYGVATQVRKAPEMHENRREQRETHSANQTQRFGLSN